MPPIRHVCWVDGEKQADLPPTLRAECAPVVHISSSKRPFSFASVYCFCNPFSSRSACVSALAFCAFLSAYFPLFIHSGSCMCFTHIEIAAQVFGRQTLGGVLWSIPWTHVFFCSSAVRRKHSRPSHRPCQFGNGKASGCPRTARLSLFLRGGVRALLSTSPKCSTLD